MKEFFVKLKEKHICALIFISGLVIVILSHVECSYYDKYPILQRVLDSIGTAVLVSGIVSFIMGISNVGQIFGKVLSNILNDEFPFDKYSDEALNDFKSNITSFLMKRKYGTVELSESIYQAEGELLEYVLKPYYEDYTVKYRYTPAVERNYIKVEVDMSYTIVNKYKCDNKINFKLDTYQTVLDGNELKVHSFKVNGVDCSKEIRQMKPCATNTENQYDYEVSIDKKINKSHKKSKIEFRYQYTIPMHDIMQTVRLSKSCKNMDHKIRVFPDMDTGDEWGLKTNLFSAFYTVDKLNEPKRRIDQGNTDEVTVRYNEWALPGTAYVTTLYKIPK